MKPYLFIFLLSASFLSFTGWAQENTVKDSLDVPEGSIFEKVDQEAAFPGGFDAWRKFLEKNLNPNVPVDNDAPVGKYTVYIQFVVDRNGTVSDIKPLTRIGYGMEAEVVRILKKSGSWTPAMQNNRAVKAYRKQPVTFVVEDDSFEISSATPYVLYTGTDNEITLKVNKVKSEDIQLAISQGTITMVGNGRYIVKVNKPGRVIFYITNAKKNKPVGSASFEVVQAKDK
ncbi:MAG TPA: energy transducer TonB [Chitinophagaceae bacterium]